MRKSLFLVSLMMFSLVLLPSLRLPLPAPSLRPPPSPIPATATTPAAATPPAAATTPAAVAADNPCGSDPSYSYLTYSGNTWNLSLGDDLAVEVTSHCNLLNQTMILDYDLTSPSNQTLSTGSWNWTALMTSDTHWVNHSNLSEYGNYYLNVTLSYINANGSLIQLDSYQVWAWVDGCGVVPSQASVYAWQSMYNLQTGDNVTWTASSSCLVLNTTMFLDYEVRAPSGALTSSGSINWTANSTYRTDVCDHAHQPRFRWMVLDERDLVLSRCERLGRGTRRL